MILVSLALAAAQAPQLPSSPDPMPPRREAPAQAPTPAPPPADPAEVRYRACTALVRTDPDAALASAETWRGENGGGVLSRLCLGQALAALERWAPAAATFELAARDAEAANDPRRADFWVQAGNAWVAAGDGRRALAAFDAALLTPNLSDELRGEVHLDRGRAQVALGSNPAARTEIDRALQLVPSDPMAWYLSAALARREGSLARAGTDIARALQLAPGNPDIALLAGTIAGQNGNMDEAYRLYRQVADTAPDSEAGRQARESLATLREIEVDAPAPAAPLPASPAPAPRPQSR